MTNVPLTNQAIPDDRSIIFDLFDVFPLPMMPKDQPTTELAGDSIMRIDIQALGFSLTEGLRTHAEQRLRFALGSASSRISRVVVRVSDANGPRGSVDKLCVIRASLPGTAPVIIEHHEADLYVAIDRASDRVARTVLRRLARTSDARRTTRFAGAGEPPPDTPLQ